MRFRFFIEGEEEVENPHLAPVAAAHAGVIAPAPHENIRLNDYFQHIVYLVSLIHRFAAP